ncbi:MAG: molybdopterin-synthase adenylyltransferase MoeB [Verrucomicrobiales bacterium]|nr:molybdopterin-synthase adenylyltransferase MoeB [Verrucomicrobiales bacterium]
MNSIIDPDRLESCELTPQEYQRYARHLSMPEVGEEGQRRLKAASILCIGAGGLGSPIAMYLAAAGVGRLGLVDPDVVDTSNLQRQILHGNSDVDRPKLDSARDTLREINPLVKIDTYQERFTSDNARQIAEPYDIIIDGTDNFATRYLSNDLAVLTRKPNVYGSIFRFEGQCSVFAPHLGGPCYRCMFPEPPEPGMVPSCAEGGVLGVLPGVVGNMQAIEAIKLIIGIGTPLLGRLIHFDALHFKFRDFKLRRDPQCPVCGEHPTISDLIDYDEFCGTGRVNEKTTNLTEIDVHELKDRIEQRAERPFLLLDVREPNEQKICCLPESILIPLGELSQRLHELDRDSEIIIHCKAGGRSAKALKLLTDNGFKKTSHVQGGIDAWSKHIDSAVPRY